MRWNGNSPNAGSAGRTPIPLLAEQERMSDSLDVIAKSIIDEAVELDGRARAELVSRRCAGAPGLRERVDGLLAAMEIEDRFLSAPSTGIDIEGGFVEEAPGDRIGAYRLLERIGQGGFGTVFLAEQSAPLERRVALKVIRPGMDSRQVLARFATEQQALALMDHPNIARVFDAGMTDRGRPYLVMEHVRGEAVTRFCDSEQMSIRQRLLLFLEICNAIRHAHQKGVIHRDLKPSNILVTTENGRPVAKVIDFGIAKALRAPRDGRSSVTEAHHPLGTLEYMSPEQAQSALGGVDTRSDIYSLGVILYELLTGATPYEADRLRDATLAEWQRVLAKESPLRPSQRCSSGAVRIKTAAGPSDAPTDTARLRGADAGTLARALRGDLDCIVMKCLECVQDQRYQSVDALADDIERYLSDVPILASPLGAAYRFRKFVRRHRIGVFAGSIVIVGLAAGLVTAAYGLTIAQEQRDAARAAQDGEKQQRLSAQRVSSFLEQMLSGAAPEVAAGKDTSLFRVFLDDAVKRIERGELRDSPEAEADLRITLANTYHSIGDGATSLRLLAPFDEQLASIINASDTVRERLVDAQAMALSIVARFDEANARFRELAALRRSLYGAQDKRVAIALAAIATNLTSQGRIQESVDVSNEALEIAKHAGDSGTLANVLTNLAEPLGMLGDRAGAIAAAESALEHCRRAYSADHPHLAEALNNLAAMLAESEGQAERVIELLRESVEMKRRLYPGGHPHLGIGLHNLARALQDHGEFKESERRYKESLECLRKFEPHFSADLIATQLNYANLARTRQQSDLQESLARDALAQCERLYPAGHETTALALMNIATSLRDRGRNADAVDYFLRSVEIQRRVLPADHPLRGNALSAAGTSQVDAGRAGEAVAPLREALEIRRRQVNADPLLISASLADLASAMLTAAAAESGADEATSLRNAREAEALAEECLRLRRELLAPDDWRIVNADGIRIAAQVELLGLDRGAEVPERVAKIREAESALLAGYEQLEQSSRGFDETRRTRILATAARRLVRLYETYRSITPSEDAERSAEQWRARVAELVPTGG